MKNGGLVGSVLGQVFSWADKPWKLVSLVLSVLVLGAGYAAWERRAEIAAAIIDHTVAPHLRVDRFDDAAQQLIKNTAADLVLLSRVSIPSNTVTNVAGRYVADPAWVPRPDVRVIFGGDISLNQLIDAVEGRVVCADVPPTNGHRMLIELGMKRVCWCGIPPIADVLVGAILIAFKTALPPDLENGAKAELRKQAFKLATW